MTISTTVQSWIEASPLDAAYKTRLIKELTDNPDIAQKLNDAFEKTTDDIPLIIWNEYKDAPVVLFAKSAFKPQEPGEPGSILAYVRAYHLGDDFLCSDCYGQLSCSSCAVEVLQGTLENPEPREEEYDMLDIDEEKPATTFTRLGCQSVVGTEPLLIKIRKPVFKV